MQAERWVTQTRFGGPEAPPEARGDCWQACMASVLGLPLEAVPRFMELAHPEWWDETRTWLRERGLDIIELDYGSWVESFMGWLVIATGKSPRGDWHHAVVWRTGEGLVHDPHPSRQGLEGEPTRVALIVAVDPMEVRRAG